MHIVWDEPKRLTNLEKNELDFRDLTESWFEQATVKAARDGRHKAIGSLDGHIVAGDLSRAWYGSRFPDLNASRTSR